MVLVDGAGTPLGLHVEAASPAEVKLLDPTLTSVRVRRAHRAGRPRQRPERLIADRAYDSNPVRAKLAARHIEPIIPARSNNHQATHQDGRRLRRYRRRWIVGVSREGSLTQSVQVRPRLTDSGLVAREAPGRESKPVKPSDITLGKESLQRSRLQRAVNADVASSHATPVAEPVYYVRRQQGPSERSLPRRSSPAGSQRRHGAKGERATGEVRGVRRRKLAAEAWPITVRGKWPGWLPDGGSGCSTGELRAAKRAGREGPGPVGIPFDKGRQG